VLASLASEGTALLARSHRHPHRHQVPFTVALFVLPLLYAVPGAGRCCRRPGSGLANLGARVQAAGGRLASRRADGRFDLVAEIPLTPPPG
jgi:hypothetical protein